MVARYKECDGDILGMHAVFLEKRDAELEALMLNNESDGLDLPHKVYEIVLVE